MRTYYTIIIEKDFHNSNIPKSKSEKRIIGTWNILADNIKYYMLFKFIKSKDEANFSS